MAYGYQGKILRVNLTSGEITTEAPPDSLYRLYMGGSALALHYLLNEMPKGVDPLGPDNVLVISTGVMTGAPISGLSRVMANAKSPLTGGVGDAQGGGFWPVEFKNTGFDAIIIKGKSTKPVYLWINNGQAELRDASHLWGKLTGEVDEQLKAELGDQKIEILQIGQAGENLVKYACIINMSQRACGRTGMGAVMGSKNLKAVVVRGASPAPIANREKIRELAKWGVDNLEDVGNLARHGTANLVPDQEAAGGLPTRNWTSGTFEGWDKISGQTMSRTILTERDTCYGCAVRCKRVVKTGEPYNVDPYYGGPEYETVATFGSYCGVDDLAAVSKANELCNKYGVDTISCGATIAFAMDCYEHGVINKDTTDGIELSFGNGPGMVQMVEKIAKREGFGAVLAEGTRAAAEKIGGDAWKYAVQVKGNELPAHMPEVKRSLGLMYAVNPFGADHMSSEHDPGYAPDAAASKLRHLRMLGLDNPQPDRSMSAEKVRFGTYSEYMYSVLDCLGTCQFVWGGAWQLYDPNQMVEALKAITGWDTSLYDVMKAGQRRVNLLRAFNAREGFGRKDDTLPFKVQQPKVGGASEGELVPQEQLDQAIDLYYQMNGWDNNGVPTRGTLAQLGIEWVADVIGV